MERNRLRLSCCPALDGLPGGLKVLLGQFFEDLKMPLTLFLIVQAGIDLGELILSLLVIWIDFSRLFQSL